MKFIGVVLLVGLGFFAKGQHNFIGVVKASGSNAPVAGATVEWKEKNMVLVTDSAGFVAIREVPAGRQSFIVSVVGMASKTFTINFPLASADTLVFELEPAHEEEEEVIVMATRMSRSISNTPTRMEVISGEELQEKANMKPGDIRMMLNETTGIQTQQTSATSFNAGIRIQGLDGRYTQLLRDGYPLYSGFSGGLSIMQVSPLDLKQVEVIKGSASTLYGGGAIAGLVNLVSKTPRDEREISFIANATSARGLDLSGFYSEKYGKAGITVYAARNSNGAFDPAGIGLTAIPEFERYTVNPRLFLYGKKTSADIGVSYITETRTGGNVQYIKNGTPGYFEKNNTGRITTQLGITHRLSDRSRLQLKNSYTNFDRSITIPDYAFDALQQSSFSELTLHTGTDKLSWVLGLNFLTDDMEEKKAAADSVRDYHYKTYGLFAQGSWVLNDKFTLEAGLRGDHVNEYGFELLPRLSAMLKISSRFTSRLSGGLGYKTPTIFTEESERRIFKDILPINYKATRNEKSYGGNWDLDYKAKVADIDFTANLMFFYTRLDHPLVLVPSTGSNLYFINSTAPLDSKGIEANLRFVLGDFKLFSGYTYTDANSRFGGEKYWLPLTARHRVNNVLMYEKEEQLKIGLEAYYFSKQRLGDGTNGKPYWIMGFMVEKLWERFSVYINFENFTDTRQTKFGTIYSGDIDNPQFKDIYAPVEGFVINGGIKLRF